MRFKQFFKSKGNPFDPFMLQAYTGFLFYGTIIIYGISQIQRTPEDAEAAELAYMTDQEREVAMRMKEKKRPPWPVLHHQATQMREGKLPYEGIDQLWKDTQYYYRADWLIPVEIAQILKYNSGKYMSEFVEEPESMKKEIMMQLLSIKYGRVKGVDVISSDVQEILTLTLEDLSKLDLTDVSSVPLTPTH
eukprot:PhM_4_TR6391/c0_g1_i1/m.63354